MQTVPLQPVPAQTVKTVLGGQNVQIFVQQKPRGVFVDVAAGGVDIVDTVAARDAAQLVCREYVGFIGNLVFLDGQGTSDPEYTGLGSRFQLVYLSAEENAIIFE